MPEQHAHDPYAALRVPSYRWYSLGYFVSVLGRQALNLAIGYEVFQRTRSATALGMVGLAYALPVIGLALPAGQLADRWDRRLLLLWTQVTGVFISLAIAATSIGWIQADFAAAQLAARGLDSLARFLGEKNGVDFDSATVLMLALLFLASMVRTFGWAARGPLVTNLVPRDVLANAVTWNSSNFQVSSILGPALCGGLIARFGSASAYFLDALCSAVFVLCIAFIRHQQGPRRPSAGHWRDVLSGIRFVWRMKVILATITLDLFAVLLGGAIVLLPIYAEQILHCGATGLGWLRSAPPLGAVLMGMALAHLPPMRRAGLTLLWSVAGFGVVTIIFGLSRSFALSFAMLALSGALDNVSIVVRHTLVQLLTPDDMRGRVTAVNNVFVGSSNELGALRSGLVAATFGPVISVVSGGIATILVVLGVAAIWPEVRRIGRLRDTGEIPPTPDLADETQP